MKAIYTFDRIGKAGFTDLTGTGKILLQRRIKVPVLGQA